MTDPTQFHYYDQPQQYSVQVSFHARTSITVTATSKEEAREKVEAMIDEADRKEELTDLLDLEEVDDPDIDYVTSHPTRMYLLTRPGGRGETASSHLQPGDLPRAPTERDQEMADSFGYTVSWKPEDIARKGGDA